MKTVGSRAEVWHGTAKKTSGGLLKKDLKKNKRGRIVSKKMSNRAKKEKRLEKAGYKTKKGVFKKFKAKKRGGENKNINEARGKAAKMFQNAENNYHRNELEEELLDAIYNEKIKKINSLLIEVNKLNRGTKKKILKGLLNYAINAKIEDKISNWETAFNHYQNVDVDYDPNVPFQPTNNNLQIANDAWWGVDKFEDEIYDMVPNEEIIDILLSKGIDINEVDENGNTALINAAKNLYIPAIDMLLKKGADPKISNNDSKTAIDYLDPHKCEYTPHPGDCNEIRELLTEAAALPAAAPAAGGSKKRRKRKTTKRKSKK